MRNRLIRIIVLVLVQVFVITCSHEIKIHSERTISESRDAFHEQLISKTINAALMTPLNESSEGLWQGAFWAVELSGHRSSLTDSAVTVAVQSFRERSRGFQRALLEVVYTLYPKEFQQEILEFLPTLNSEKLFAMAVHYLLKADPELDPQTLLSDLDLLYPDWSLDPILWSLVSTLEDTLPNHPPIADLLHAEFISGLPVLFSFQPENRDYSGLLVIRDAKGNFVKNSHGSLVSMKHLGRAVTNLPWYLTNGNTPPGIYSIQGLGSSNNVFIGPTPTVQMRMPFEINLASFMHDPELKQDWDYQYYDGLLPPTWQDYFPIWGSYFAGEAGRSEIIAHGSTINPEYYRDLPCYPLTPSLGCLTTYEAWSEADGSLIQSDQQQLVDLMDKFDIHKGFLVVVPIPEINHNLEIKDLEVFFSD